MKRTAKQESPETTKPKKAKKEKPVPACDSRFLWERFPDIAKEWHHEKNQGIDLKTVRYGSHKNFWWKCPKVASHEWDASPNNRSKGVGCRLCNSTHVVRDSNRLSLRRPDLVEEWHPNKNGAISPDDVPVYSVRDVWWICKAVPGHEWEAKISSRTNMNSGCPWCNSTKIIRDSNRLSLVKPELVKQWNSRKNGPLLPSDVAMGSDRKVWWICSSNHEWDATISSRVHGADCPHCSSELYCNGSSKTEQALTKTTEILFNISHKNTRYHTNETVIQDTNVLYGTKFRNSLRPDIWLEINNKNIFIEYDGWPDHDSDYGIQRDKAKSMILLHGGNVVIRIRPPKYRSLNLNEPNYYEFQNDCQSAAKIYQVLTEIRETLIRDGHIQEEPEEDSDEEMEDEIVVNRE